MKRRGFALPFTLLLLALLAGGLTLVLLAGRRSVENRRDDLSRVQSYYAAEAASQMAIASANLFLRTRPNATSADLATYFDTAHQAAVTPAGYELETFSLTTTGRVDGPLPSGPFARMLAHMYPMSLSLRLRKNEAVAAAEQHRGIVLAQVPAFQFFLFSDVFLEWFNAPPAVVKGRVHANTDVCLGGREGLAIERLTSAGRLMVPVDSRCRSNETSGRTHLKIAVDGQCAGFPTQTEWAAAVATYPAAEVTVSTSGGGCTFQEVDTNHDNGCATSTCAGGWISYAQNTWRGNAADSAHGVARIRLPFSGTPKVFAGLNAGAGGTTSPTIPAGSLESNRQNLRLLVDPVLAGEDPTVARQKLAYKADLRIVNGIWFLRDPSDETSLGTPIWSDHPGDFTYTPSTDTLAGNPTAVGQATLRAARGWGTATPGGYSYYEAKNDGSLIDNDGGVVSYGTLFRDGGASWRPGFSMRTDGSDGDNDEAWCTPPSSGPTTKSDATTVVMRDATAPTSSSTCPTQVDRRAALLHATQSGFKNQHARVLSVDPTAPSMPLPSASSYDVTKVNVRRERHARTLPINFDVAAFQAALANTSAGELGSYFGASRTFNGIVFITSTWPGMNAGMSSTADVQAVTWPDLQASDTTQPSGSSGYIEPHFSDASAELSASIPGIALTDALDGQAALPAPLCSSSVAGAAYDTTTGTRYRVPSCAAYAGASPTLKAFPNALRVMNAASINPSTSVTVGRSVVPIGMLPHGLSIVTNLPLYVLGDVNTSSDTSGELSTPWVPMLLAGDQLFTQSNAWEDTWAPWGGALKPPLGVHRATATTLNAQLLVGLSPSAPDARSTGRNGGGVNASFGYLEDWDGVRHTMRGAILFGFAPTVSFFNQTGLSIAYTAADRDWAYDEHLDAVANQPPGAPEFIVVLTQTFTRDDN
jgi:hypothetical protein